MSILNNPYSYQLCNAQQCRDMDSLTIQEFGISGFTLMETAGLQAARIIAQQLSGSLVDQVDQNAHVSDKHTGRTGHAVNESSRLDSRLRGLFICGKGNNGGDALVTARYLSLHHQHSCTILLLEGNGKLSEDSAKNLELLKKMAGKGADIDFIEGPEMPSTFDSSGAQRWDYLVDGMLGTGLSSAPRAPYDKAVSWVNAQSSPCFALDISTGLNSDTGQIMGEAVVATETLSFGARKLGFYLADGPDTTGHVTQVNLSFPVHVRESSATLLVPEMRKLLAPVLRQRAKHKYSDGVVYIIAGSDGLTGAAIMAARSAWKTGAGAVFLFAPRGLLDIYEKALPEIIKIPVGEKGMTHYTPEDAGTILQTMEKHPGTLLVGPGLGREEESLALVQNILKDFKGKSVIDADALYATDPEDRPADATWILTPHPGELAKMTGHNSDDHLSRLDQVKAYSKSHGITLISKGHPTIVGTSDGDGYLTGYETRIFSRAGFGDVLAGKIAGFTAITDNPVLSSLHALLDGYEKASAHLQADPKRAVEPEDLI